MSTLHELQTALEYADDTEHRDWCRRVLAAEVRRLQAELAELRKDKERLDWLDENAVMLRPEGGEGDLPHWAAYMPDDNGEWGKLDIEFDGPRDAIDAARKATP